MALTVDQRNFVQGLANLSYGTGWREGTAGGKGNMGLMYGLDGTVHVVKFNTHHSQATDAQKKVAKGDAGVQSSLQASENLRNELCKLAKSAGLGEETVNQLLGDNTKGKSLLTRKVVAGFVSKLADKNSEIGQMNVWDVAQTEHLKSASDMSFEKVVDPDEQHRDFNRSVDNLNDAIVKEFKDAEQAWTSLDPEAAKKDAEFGGKYGIFKEILNWKGSDNENLTPELIDAARAHLVKLDDLGYDWIGKKDLKDAMVNEIMRHEPALGEAAVTALVDGILENRAGAITKGVRFQVCSQHPDSFESLVKTELQKAGADLAQLGFTGKKALKARNAHALENRVFAWVQENLKRMQEMGEARFVAEVGKTRGEQRAWARNFLAARPNLQKYLAASTTAEAIKYLNDSLALMISDSVGQGKRSELSINGFAGTFLREISRPEVEIMTINGKKTRNERVNKNVDLGLSNGAMASYDNEHIKAVVEQLAELLPDEGMRHFVTSIISHNGLSMALGQTLMIREQDPGEGIKGGFAELLKEHVVLGGSQTIPQEIHIDVAKDGTISLDLKTSYCYKFMGKDQVTDVGMTLELANYPLEMKVTIPGGQHIAVGEVPEYTAEVKPAVE